MGLDSATLEGNRLLTALSSSDLARLERQLRVCDLLQGQVVYQINEVITESYFVLTAVCSYVTVMSDGVIIEAGAVGNEGGLGLNAFSGTRSANRVVVQIAGQALKMDSAALFDAICSSKSLQKQMARYHTAFLTQVSQSVACNGLHKIEQRCCRWLLMTRDRVGSDSFPLTHEYLAYMLGVRRSGVTEVLQSLKERNILDYTRGNITILDREGLGAVACECYQVVKDRYRELYGS